MAFTYDYSIYYTVVIWYFGVGGRLLGWLVRFQVNITHPFQVAFPNLNLDLDDNLSFNGIGIISQKNQENDFAVLLFTDGNVLSYNLTDKTSREITYEFFFYLKNTRKNLNNYTNNTTQNIIYLNDIFKCARWEIDSGTDFSPL